VVWVVLLCTDHHPGATCSRLQAWPGSHCAAGGGAQGESHCGLKDMTVEDVELTRAC
jgi:hypothetical protein